MSRYAKQGGARFRRVVVGGLIGAALFTAAPAPALFAGCAVVVSGSQQLPTSCIFTATGPVDIATGSVSGWRVYRSRDGGQSWVEIATSAGTEIRPTHVNVTVKRLTVQPFDLVKLSIVRANESTPLGPVSYQNGFIAGTSDL